MTIPSRIQNLFTHAKANIAYLTAGDGGIQRSLEAALALINGGANMLEIGMPFSDPIADGPIIQRAATRSLLAGTTIKDILWLAQEIRKHSEIPLVLFSYLNPILSALQSNFLKEAKNLGFDGLLLVDCPLEESYLIREQCIQNGIDLIYVIAPSTSIRRMQKIAEYAQGFVYYACRKGITGVHNNLPDDFEHKIASIKCIVDLPVVVGFGISNRAMVRDVLKFADGVVLGSVFVKALEDDLNHQGLIKLAKDIF